MRRQKVLKPTRKCTDIGSVKSPCQNTCRFLSPFSYLALLMLRSSSFTREKLAKDFSIYRSFSPIQTRKRRTFPQFSGGKEKESIMNWGCREMERRKYDREFKLEVLRLIQEGKRLSHRLPGISVRRKSHLQMERGFPGRTAGSLSWKGQP